MRILAFFMAFLGLNTAAYSQIDTSFNKFEQYYNQIQIVDIPDKVHIIEDTLNTKIYFNGKIISYRCFDSSFANMVKRFPENVSLDSITYDDNMNVYCSGDNFIVLECND